MHCNMAGLVAFYGIFRVSGNYLGLLFVAIYPTFTLNIYPTKAVNPIATVPQKVTLKTALPILEPPVLAVEPPKIIKNIVGCTW